LRSGREKKRGRRSQKPEKAPQPLKKNGRLKSRRNGKEAYCSQPFRRGGRSRRETATAIIQIDGRSRKDSMAAELSRENMVPTYPAEKKKKRRAREVGGGATSLREKTTSNFARKLGGDRRQGEKITLGGGEGKHEHRQGRE